MLISGVNEAESENISVQRISKGEIFALSRMKREQNEI